MMSNPEKQKVIAAINDLGRRVTVADVATKTGLPILKVASELNKVAAETGGSLQVATTGDIAYKFDLGFQNAYLAKGITRVIGELGKTVFQVGFFLLRISFGVMLILSLLIILVVVVAVILRMGDRDDDSGGGGGFSMDFFDFLILRDLFWWNYDPYYNSYNSYGQIGGYSNYGQYNARPPVKKKGNFFFNCFSFLFGDGNPNRGLDEKRWQLIAQVIKQNNGALTAEQLAPYTGEDPKDEGGALPVLVRFDGRPEVTSAGNIVYLFPSLQVTAGEASHHNSLSSYSGDSSHNGTPSFLEEEKWLFSNASVDELMPVILLASINLLGSWWLLSIVHASTMLASLVLVLVIYGTAFVAVPLVRYGAISMLNTNIESRNAKREDFALKIRNADKALASKLAEAQSLAHGDRTIGTQNIVYTTEKDVLEQEFQ